jgi:hypothetical protein
LRKFRNIIVDAIFAIILRNFDQIWRFSSDIFYGWRNLIFKWYNFLLAKFNDVIMRPKIPRLWWQFSIIENSKFKKRKINKTSRKLILIPRFPLNVVQSWKNLHRPKKACTKLGYNFYLISVPFSGFSLKIWLSTQNFDLNILLLENSKHVKKLLRSDIWIILNVQQWKLGISSLMGNSSACKILGGLC